MFVRGEKVSQNPPQPLPPNTQHVLTYVTLSACSYPFASLQLPLCSDFDLRSLGLDGDPWSGACRVRALCWRLS